MNIKLVIFTIFWLSPPLDYAIAAGLPTDADILLIASKISDMEVSDTDSAETIIDAYVQSTSDQGKKTFAVLTGCFVNLRFASDTAKAKQLLGTLTATNLTSWQQFYLDCAAFKISSLAGINSDSVRKIDDLLQTYNRITDNLDNPMCRALKTGIEGGIGDLRAVLLSSKADCLRDLGEGAQAKTIADQLVREYPASKLALQVKAEY